MTHSCFCVVTVSNPGRARVDRSSYVDRHQRGEPAGNLAVVDAGAALNGLHPAIVIARRETMTFARFGLPIAFTAMTPTVEGDHDAVVTSHAGRIRMPRVEVAGDLVV